MWHILMFVYQGQERYYANTSDGGDVYWSENLENAIVFRSKEAAQHALLEPGSLPVLDLTKHQLIYHLNEYTNRNWWTIDGAEAENIVYQVIPLVKGEPVDIIEQDVVHDTVFGKDGPRLSSE